MTLARNSIAQGDCQLLLVSVFNPSDRPIRLDWIFDPGCFGPAIEMDAGSGKYEQVMAMGQGGASCLGETIIPAKGEVSEFLLMALEEGWEGNEPLFRRPGKYKLRARVSIGQVPLVSEVQEMNVTDSERVIWPDKKLVKEQARVFSSPTKEFLETIPATSLLRESRELLLLGRDFMTSPDELRARWLEARKKANSLIADKIGLTLVSQLVQNEQYELALEELNRMKVQPQAAVGYKQHCKEKLGLQESGKLQKE
jgi:hypothetical protein